jgi:N-formylglutamate deformylase
MSAALPQTEVFRLHRGSTPLLVSLPHVGTSIPEELQDAYQDRALALEDTDWHLDSLYDFAVDLGASLIVPRIHRYVIDLNRPPEDAPMYSGANNTELCPTRFFSGEPLYKDGRIPDAGEVARRRAAYWRPYHDALRGELDRIRGLHGHALLLDGHSIRSELPWLFEGKLPDLNLGTAGGKSCADSLRTLLVQALGNASRFTFVVDGRFQGGYITRHYGEPDLDVHAVQLEMCWSCYMDEVQPFRVNECRAVYLRPVLRELVAMMLFWGAQHA